MMQYLAYFSIAFLAFQFLGVVLNSFFPQRIHRHGTSLNELVSVLIPARNEEENIGALLNDLSGLHGQNLEIIVFDDNSMDRTSAIVQGYAAKDQRIQLLHSEGLPGEWLGKNHACYQLAKHATGRYLLFLDADVRIDGQVIEDAVLYLQDYGLGLLSAFPIQIQKTFGERVSVPVMNYVLLTLLPLIFVRISPFASHSAANGQFMLFDAETYRQNQPHQRFKMSAVEDIAIANDYKKKKIKTACITGDERIRCRMYQSYKEALHGFSKNVFMFFGNKPGLAFLFWIVAALGFIPVLLSSIWPLVISYFSVLFLVLVLYSLSSKQNVPGNVLLFPLQLLFLLHVMCTSMINKKTKDYSWKGRNIYT